jgi:hypothetical protein
MPMALSTRVHGYVDYLAGGILVVLPVLSGIARGPAGITLIVAGVVLILTALATDFEAGVVRHLQIPLHLWIDGIVGLLLAVSPWLLSFYRTAWIPHVIIGIALIAFAFLTNTVPGYDRRRSGSPAA